MSLNPSRDPLSSYLATGTRLKDWMRAIYRVHLKAVHSIRIHLDRKFVVGRRSRCVGVRAVILTPKGNKTMEHTATIDIFSNASRLPPLLHPSARTGTSRDEWFASQGCPWPSPTTRFFFFSNQIKFIWIFSKSSQGSSFLTNFGSTDNEFLDKT